jgi:hypothetical protein
LKEVVRVHAEPSPVSVNLEQQRKLAKNLVRAARAGDPAALARIGTVRLDTAAPARSLKLARWRRAIGRCRRRCDVMVPGRGCSTNPYRH